MSYSAIPKLLTLALRSNSTISTFCSDRIHYQVLPQKSVYPHIYIARSGKDNESLLDGDDGVTTEYFTVEVVSQTFNEDACDAIEDVLGGLTCVYDGVEVHCSNVDDVDDNYVFKSADSDALFLHGFKVAVYCTH